MQRPVQFRRSMSYSHRLCQLAELFQTLVLGRIALRRESLPPSLLVTNLLHFDRFVNAAKICAEAKIQAAEKEAAKILAKAEAEGESAEFLVAKREYDYKQKKLVVETSLLEAVPLVVSGKMATN
ncbi:hypothetical protein PF005_g25218 [Phytophthora fragariae]|uniref:Uncharacterized protein n=1 Tax=Phytophthora fragariae TaxID=53985 RepID=A0A6A3W4I5_9STRA|nr:hypothetical protein PF005_g25218 [Phytophthora fragariae]